MSASSGDLPIEDELVETWYFIEVVPLLVIVWLNINEVDHRCARLGPMTIDTR